MAGAFVNQAYVNAHHDDSLEMRASDYQAARQDTVDRLQQFTDDQLAAPVPTVVGEQAAGDLFAGRAGHAAEHITSIEEGFRRGAGRLVSFFAGLQRLDQVYSRRGIMKYLLTSSGISNDSIHDALVDLLGKPIAESSALCIPTAAYACPGGAAMAWRFLRGVARSPLCELGWKSLGVLELTALPSIDEERWLPLVQETDALLVYGGDVLYLCYWMRQSGLADLLPELSRETVYVGVSAGSMVVTPNFGVAYDGWFCREPPARNLPAGSERALGLVDFSVFPHLDLPESPDNSLANAERWAAKGPVPTYAIDDQTAIVVRDGVVEVVSEGHWKRLTP